MKEQEEVRKLYRETVPYLLHWYDYNKRILPWREDPTPYHVWVSEIMLQQTRVEAVRGYYDRFLTSLPDINALAEAEEEVLLKLWEGLGYYNRVRNMQKAAKMLVEQYDGEMPADYNAIRALPGIGDYTAGAVSSIAFGLPYPAVDGNVLRVMSRIACSEDDIAKESTKQQLKQDLTAIMPENSGDFNQSLMELGATVCIPNGKPLCEQCPVMHLCRAFHAGRETELPVKSGKKERRIEKRTVFLVTCGRRILLHRRPKKGLLAGLWEFPNVQMHETEDVQEMQTGTKQGCMRPGDALKRVERSLSEMFGEIVPEGNMPVVEKGKKAKHIFSHVEWHMEGIRIETDTAEQGMTERLREVVCRLTESADCAEDWVFITPEQMRETYPIPSAFEVYVKAVLEQNGTEE